MLFDVMLEAMAWDDLHNIEVGGKLNAEQLLELARAAGLSEDVAQKLATERADARLDQGLPM